ncbi:MAG: 30S ribosomal protein S3 [Chloroflexi bacterium]|nr:30S ribosomal protein S3 [Chloroflexota bacterium]
MGRKINPIGFRLSITKDWESKWFAEGTQYGELVVEDEQIRRMIRQELGRAGIAKIEIQRFPKQIAIRVFTAKPGVVIGRRGANINALKAKLEEMTNVTGKNLRLDVIEVEQPDLSAPVVAEGIVEQLERRVSQKRVMRQAINRAIRAGAKGIKVICSGRLAGAEMARREWMHEGRVPLHTLRADVDFAVDEALTTFGRIGVKVWIYRGDIMPAARRGSEAM